jgi:hypothetical protein
MQFNPLVVPTLILTPLRYYFSTYTSKQKLVYNDDPNLRTMDIDFTNNLNDISLGDRPRILVDRGSYQINKTGLSDNMASGKPFSETRGLEDRINFVLYEGTATLVIEARQMGVCELLTDMATHFIVWSRPLICDSQGFKEFGLPMSVSNCQLLPNSEDDEKFQVNISFPYIKEERWKVRNDGVLLKAINQSINAL